MMYKTLSNWVTIEMMYKTLFVILLALLSFKSLADQQVNGYTRQDGTYVAPYMRSNPNSFRFDNFSSQGNYNPYTGQRGHEPNEFSSPPVHNYGNPYPSGDYSD